MWYNNNMKKYSGLGHENLEFDQAMLIVKENIHKLDEYVLDILFDILMEEEENDCITAIYNRS